MASINSLRCLLRPGTRAVSLTQPIIIFPTTSPFSTSSAVSAAAPPAVKSRRDLPKVLKKSFKKGKSVATAKKPNPGERKAYRKRIQLSNNSALAVTGLDTVEADTMASRAMESKVVALPDQLVDQLRSLEAFKITHSWGLFRRPHMLVRKETVDLMEKLHSATEQKKAYKAVLRGSKISGKSMLLLQALSYGLLNGWTVIHVPECQDLTNGNTEYSPVAGTNPPQFSQPTYCLKLIQSIYKANKALLETLPLQQDWSRLATIGKNATIADLLLNARDGDNAWPTLQAAWTELTLPGRPPLLLTLDGLAHLNMVSEYLDPACNKIHAHDLTVVRLLIDALSGKAALPNGGAVLAAESENNSYNHPSQVLVLSQIEAAKNGLEIPQPEPYKRGYDERVYESLKDVDVLRVGGMSKEETRSLLEYWGASGLFRAAISSSEVVKKWAMGGHGNIGEVERVALATPRM